MVQYENDLAAFEKAQRRLVERKDAIFLEQTQKHLPVWLGKIKTSYRYDADAEHYQIVLTSSRYDDFKISGVLPFPIAQAKKLNDQIRSAPAYAVLSIDGGVLKAKGVAVRVNDKIFAASDVAISNTLAFTEPAAHERTSDRAQPPQAEMEKREMTKPAKSEGGARLAAEEEKRLEKAKRFAQMEAERLARQAAEAKPVAFDRHIAGENGNNKQETAELLAPVPAQAKHSGDAETKKHTDQKSPQLLGTDRSTQSVNRNSETATKKKASSKTINLAITCDNRGSWEDGPSKTFAIIDGFPFELSHQLNINYSSVNGDDFKRKYDAFDSTSRALRLRKLFPQLPTAQHLVFSVRKWTGSTDEIKVDKKTNAIYHLSGKFIYRYDSGCRRIKGQELKDLWLLVSNESEQQRRVRADAQKSELVNAVRDGRKIVDSVLSKLSYTDPNELAKGLGVPGCALYRYQYSVLSGEGKVLMHSVRKGSPGAKDVETSIESERASVRISAQGHATALLDNSHWSFRYVGNSRFEAIDGMANLVVGGESRTTGIMQIEGNKVVVIPPGDKSTIHTYVAIVDFKNQQNENEPYSSMSAGQLRQEKLGLEKLKVRLINSADQTKRDAWNRAVQLDGSGKYTSDIYQSLTIQPKINTARRVDDIDCEIKYIDKLLAAR